jgi:hypothetical protein
MMMMMMMMMFDIITVMMMIMMMILNNDYENGLPIIFIESLITAPSLELDILTKTSRSAKRYLIVMMVS